VSKRRNATYKDWITEDGLIELEGMAMDGLINEEIADEIGINPSTLYDWQKKYPEIAKALKTGKKVVDRRVENALYKRAIGYTFVEVTRELTTNAKGEAEMVVTKEVLKEVEPNTTAQIFWLKNRKPHEWRDKKDVNLTSDKKLEDFFTK
jgi:transposase-like protein